MGRYLVRSLIFACCFIGSTVQADIVLRHIDGALSDSFIVTMRTRHCATDPLTIRIDLSNASDTLSFEIGATSAIEVVVSTENHNRNDFGFRRPNAEEIAESVSARFDGPEILTLQVPFLARGVDYSFSANFVHEDTEEEARNDGFDLEGAVFQVSWEVPQMNFVLDESGGVVADADGYPMVDGFSTKLVTFEGVFDETSQASVQGPGCLY